ncbi:acyl carrier protein [Phocaeicola paurosaccharolyticus]|uniref:acyl carrier protein n=1 Tax=Phocaeicola paurosaccharolyticus TaxID=732242 RepID=UPI00046A7E7A|nr:acyl carrier protein [Phocaeicola paurosaccharolyticus]
MDKNEILVKVQEIFQDVLDNEEIIINREDSADDIDEYDSLSHIQLVVAIEKEFGIKFLAKDIVSWDNFGEMLDCIEKYVR